MYNNLKKYKLSFVTIGLVFIISFLASCSYHQRSSHRLVKMSPSDTEKNSENNFAYSQQAYGGTYLQDPAVNQYIQRLGQKVVRQQNLPAEEFSFVVVNSSIPNIWSFPKGKIALTRGLLNELQDEAELVALLAHEIAHLTYGHGKENIQEVALSAGPVSLEALHNTHHKDFSVGALGSGSGLMSLKYNAQAEIEADKASMLQVSEMGYSSKSYFDFQERVYSYLKNNNVNWKGGFLAKHPLDQEQLATNRTVTSKQNYSGATAAKNFDTHLGNLKQQQQAYKKLDEGYHALLNKDYHEAIEIADRGLDLEPTEAHFYLLKGKALFKLGYNLDALRALNRAIEINSEYFDNFLQRGLIKEQLDDFAQASRDLQKSLALLPTAEAYYALGEIDYQQEETQAAIQNFKKASISASPSGLKAINRLKELGLALSGASTIETAPLFSHEGYVNIKICNTGIKPLKNVIIDVEQHDPSGRLLYSHLIELKDDLAPFQEVCHQTNIGPFFSEEEMKMSTQIIPIYAE